MSGAVDTVKDVGRTVLAPMYIPAKAGYDLVTKGANPIKTTGQEIGKDVNTVKGKAVDPLVQGISSGMGVNSDLPNIAVDDPAAKAQADAQARARTKRQTEIDILKGQPGRGGTVLTDNYQYNV